MKKSNKYIFFIVVILAITATIVFFQKSPSKPIVTTQTWEQLTVSALESMKAGKVKEAEQYCNQAMKLLDEGGKEDIRKVKTYMLMGEIHRWDKKTDLAEGSFVNAVNLCKKIYGSNHPDMVIPLESLANFYYYTKVNYEKVASLYLQILNIVEQETSYDDRKVAIRANNLAIVYQLLKQYEQAELFYKKALTLAENAKNPDKGDIIQYLMISADFYLQWRKCGQAEPLAKRALEMREDMVKNIQGIDAQLDVAICLDALGKIYLSCGNPGEAEKLYSRSLAIIERVRGKDNVDIVSRLTGLASAFQAQKQYNKAQIEYKQALEITEKRLGPNSPEVVSVLEEYAGLLNEMKEKQEAKAMLSRVDSIRKKGAEL